LPTATSSVNKSF